MTKSTNTAGLPAYNITFTNTLDSWLRKKLVSRVKGKRFESGMALLSLGVMAACGEIESLLGIDDDKKRTAPMGNENVELLTYPGLDDFTTVGPGAHAGRPFIVIGTDGADTITTGEDNDIIFAYGGADTINTGDGDDIIVLVGTNVEQYSYTASDLMVEASGIGENAKYNDINLADYLRSNDPMNTDLSDFLSAIQTDAVRAAPTTIDAGAGHDLVVIFGEVDLTAPGVDASTFTAIQVNSQLTISESQLGGLVIIGADEDSALVVEVATAGMVDLSGAELAGTLRVTEQGAGTATTFMLDGDALEFIGDSGETIIFGSEGTQTATLAIDGMVDVAALIALEKIVEESFETLAQTNGSVEITAMTSSGEMATLTANSATQVATKVGGEDLDDVLGIRGGRGDDNLTGTDEADTIRGFAGDDTLDGRAGDDNLGGGSGSDTFMASAGADRIIDFSASEGDIINFAGWEATSVSELTISVSGSDLTFTDGNDNTNSITLVGADDLITAYNADNAYFVSGAGRGLIVLHEENRAPAFTFVNYRMAEDGSETFQLQAADPDGGSGLTYRLVDAEGNGEFEVSSNGVVSIDATALAVPGLPFDFESSNSDDASYLLTVAVSDGEEGAEGVSTATETLTVTITNSNEAPTGIMNVPAVVVPGTNGSETPVSLGTVEVADPDGPSNVNQYRFSLSGNDASSFSINVNTGELFYIAATTAAGGTPLDLTVTVQDGNFDAVELDAGAIVGGVEVTGTLNEGVTSGTFTLGAVDNVFSGTPMFSVTAAGTTAGFSVSGTTLSWSGTAFDYDEAGDRTVSVELVAEGTPASGGTALTITQTVNIEIADVNDETPEITSAVNHSVDEGDADVYTIAFSDADADATNGPATYTITGADAALFTATANGEVQFKTAPDYESPADAGGDNIYNIDVEVSDGANTSAKQAVEITVTPVDEDALTAATATIVIIPGQSAGNTTDNRVVVGSVDVSDMDDDDTYTYAFTGANASNFEVDADTGEVLYISTSGIPGAGQNLDLTLMVSDSNGSVEATTTALVGGITVGGAYTLTAQAEQNSVGTEIDLGVLSAMDVFGSAATTFSVTATQGGNPLTGFAVSGGNLVIEAGTAIDFEAGNDIMVTVTATSGSETPVEVTFALPLTDVDDTSPEITSAAAFSVDEGLGFATVVHTLTASDVDTDTGLTYAITGGNPGNAFRIGDPATGVITLGGDSSSAIDFELIAESYTLTVTASDGTNTVTEQIISVTVNDINEAPDTVALSGIVIPGTTNQVIGTITFMDQDAGDDVTNKDSFTYNIATTKDGSDFTVDQDTGVVSYTGAAGDAVAGSTFMIDVSVTDAGGATSEVETVEFLVGGITVGGAYALTPQMEADAGIAAEADFGALDVATGLFTGSSSTSFTVVATRNSLPFSGFSVSNGNLVLAAGTFLNAEAAGDIMLTLTANSADGHADDGLQVVFTVPITDVDDNDPMAVAIPNQNAPLTNEFSLDLKRFLTDADSGDTLTYGVVDDTGADATANLPTGLTLDTATGIISGTPTGTEGNFTFTATISDGDSEAEAMFVIAVTAAPPDPITEMGWDNPFIGDPGTTFISQAAIDANFAPPGAKAGDVQVADPAHDWIIGNDSDNYIRGLDYNDIIEGRGGSDIIDAGAHDDTLYGGDGADYFVYRFNSSNQSARFAGIDGADRIFDFSTSQGDKFVFLDENADAATRIDTYAKLVAAADPGRNGFGVTTEANLDGTDGALTLLFDIHPAGSISRIDLDGTIVQISGLGAITLQRHADDEADVGFFDLFANPSATTIMEALDGLGGESTFLFAIPEIA